MPDEEPQHRSGKRRIEHRREKRRSVDSLTNMMRRSKAIFDMASGDMEACSILDASDNGCRISLKNTRNIEIGAPIIIEYADGTRNYDRVCWAFGNEIGLKIDWKYCRIMPDAEEQDTHDCKIITSSKDVIVIEFSAPEKFRTGQSFTLESANGVRNQVRVRWIWENEIGLKILGKIREPLNKLA